MIKYKVIVFDTSLGYERDSFTKEFVSAEAANRYCEHRSNRREVYTAVPEDLFNGVLQEKST